MNKLFKIFFCLLFPLVAGVAIESCRYDCDEWCKQRTYYSYSYDSLLLRQLENLGVQQQPAFVDVRPVLPFSLYFVKKAYHVVFLFFLKVA